MKLVAEIGINHNGNIEIAKTIIDKVAAAGIGYVKFQKRTVSDVYTPEELDAPRNSPFGETNRAQKNGLEFGQKEYDTINEYCNSKKIKWFGSPWDIKSADFLLQYNPDYIKIASALITNDKLLKYISDNLSGTKVILSSGMSTKSEIDNAVKIIQPKNIDYLLACTSSYPTPIEDMNLNKIIMLKKDYPEFKIGLSSHTTNTNLLLCAAVMDAEMIEFHVTLNRDLYGSDQKASIETSELSKINESIKTYYNALGSGDYGCMPSEIPIKKKLRR